MTMLIPHPPRHWGWALGLGSLGLCLVTGTLGGAKAMALVDPAAPPSDTALNTFAPRSKQTNSAAAAPPLPALPAPLPAAITPERSGIVGLRPTAEANLGIGHLRPRDLSFLEASNWSENPLAYAGWLRSVALPIYVSPGGEVWGWLVNGWLMIPGYDPIVIGRDASFLMVQTEPGLYSFPVLEQREDGWFQFQYTPAGAAWAHTSHLNGGAIALTIEPWEEQLETAPRVQFLRHGLSQPLRMAPRSSSALRSVVAANSLIRPLEVNGDWMRVQVIQPAQGCTPLPGSTTEEGWMRWRDDHQDLLVWFGTEANCR